METIDNGLYLFHIFSLLCFAFLNLFPSLSTLPLFRKFNIVGPIPILELSMISVNVVLSTAENLKGVGKDII